MDRRQMLSATVATAFSLQSLAAGSKVAREEILGGPCQGCDLVFEGQPAQLASRARIAPRAEAGAPMVMEGVVTTSRGAPAPGIIVYAYHTNQGGIYPPAGNPHGRLRGWVLTDAQGRYRFDTIRPGAYPERNVAEHVHMHVIEPGVGTYYIDNLEFEDDPLNPRRAGAERGGNGLMLPLRRDGVWFARRDIVLGRNIPGYS